MSSAASTEPTVPSLTVLRSKRVLVGGDSLEACDLILEPAAIGGRIRAVEPYGTASSTADQADASETLVADVGESVVMPSLVDAHVHCNDPGREHWEGFDCATRAAAAGGIGWIADMPLNSDPVTTDLAALEQKVAAARGRIFIDVSLYAGLVGGAQEQEHSMLEALAARTTAFKAFLCDSGLYEAGVEQFPPVSTALLEQAMPVLAACESTLLVHAERCDDLPVAADVDPGSYQNYLASRPVRFETEAIAEMVSLAEATGCAVHIVHVSAAESVDILRAARRRGIPVTAETCPHYLFYAAEGILDGAPAWKCAPPIRSARHQEALWQGLADGVLDFVASDHSPCPPDLKTEQGDLQAAWGGISSLQLLLPIVWTAAQRRGFGVVEIARWLSSGPARLLGASTREVAVGARADLVVWNPEGVFEVQGKKLEHRHPLTPYEGEQLHGCVERHYLAGDLVWVDGSVVGEPRGQICV